MKKLILTLLTLFALCAVSSAQVLTPGVVVQQTNPIGNCNQQAYQVIWNTATPAAWVCNSATGVWASSQTFGFTYSGTGTVNLLQNTPTILTPLLTLPIIADSTDTTKQVKFSLSGGTTAFATTLTFAPSAARTVTFPDATDTVVELGTTQTMTNKTLTNPVITGPAPVACGSTCSVSTSQSGSTFLLNQAAGSTATLPASTGSGNKYNFLITVATTSAQEKILLTTVTDVIIGTAILQNGGTAKIFVGNAGTYHSIQMPFTGTQPSGGFIGDTISCLDVAAGTWACQIVSQSGNAAPSTPYSTSTT